MYFYIYIYLYVSQESQELRDSMTSAPSTVAPRAVVPVVETRQCSLGEDLDKQAELCVGSILLATIHHGNRNHSSCYFILKNSICVQIN